MANLLVAGNSTNGGTAITTDTSGTLNIVTGSGSGSTAIAVDTSQSTTFNSAASTAPFIAKINGTEAARIDSSGNLLVGTTDSNQTSGVGSKIYGGGNAGTISLVSAVSTSAQSGFSMYSTGAGAFRFYVGYQGQINATSTSIAAISDVSLKENIRDLDTGLSQVLNLRPRRFDWKEETQIGEKNVAGFIAQEIEQVLPELVYDYQYTEGVTKKSIKMGDILPTLVKAIQEQQAMILELKAELDAVKAKVGV